MLRATSSRWEKWAGLAWRRHIPKDCGDSSPHQVRQHPISHRPFQFATRLFTIPKATQNKGMTQRLPALKAQLCRLGHWGVTEPLCLISLVCKVKITTVHLTYMAKSARTQTYLDTARGNRVSTVLAKTNTFRAAASLENSEFSLSQDVSQARQQRKEFCKS